jgi:hypothetical protein
VTETSTAAAAASAPERLTEYISLKPPGIEMECTSVRDDSRTRLPFHDKSVRRQRRFLSGKRITRKRDIHKSCG